MREHGRSHYIKGNLLKMIIMIVCGFLFVAMIAYYYIDEKKNEMKLQELANIERQNREEAEEANKPRLFYDTSADLLKGLSVREILNHDSLSQEAHLISGYSSDAAVWISLSDIKPVVDNNKLYMFVFEIYTEDSAAEIAVQNGKNTSNYYITSEPSVFYLPISSFDDFKITLVSDFQNLYVGNLSVIETDGLGSGIKYGQYDLKEVEEYEANPVNDMVGREVLVDDNSIYYLTKNALICGTINGGKFIEIGRLSGLGATVHAAFVDKYTIVITSRENDVYFVDVSDLSSPNIISTYDGLDLATGISVYGNYVFVCSRYFGVEIVDISDLSSPKLTSIVNTGGECIGSVCKDGYLYISNWNLKQVWVYDISNPNNPKKISVLDTDGNPYGIAVSGDNLFVATGHNSASESSSILDGGYGAGHGMVIYDISDPEKIEWCSTVKIDGRLLYREIDSWGVYVNGDYAFLSSTYAGVYIYDVSEPKNPVRVGKISTKIESGSDDYNYTENVTAIFPYDVTTYIEDPISSVAFTDGGVYLAGQVTGLHYLEFEDASIVEEDDNSFALKAYDGSYYENMKDSPLRNAEMYASESCIYACDINDDYVFLACGDCGIQVVDENLELINEINTPGSVQDIVIDAGYAYVAEGNYGIEIYRIDGSSLSLVSSYQCNLVSETVTQIRVSGEYLIAQNGWTRIKIFDISDPSNIVPIEDLTTGTMYLKNLINTADSGDIIGFESSREIALFSTANGLDQIGTIENRLYGERDGMCEYEGNIIAINGNGYVIFSEEDIRNNKDLSELIIYSCGNDYKLKGKVTCSDDIMVVADSVGKQIAIVDISDLTSPVISEYFSVNGNPMLSKITEKYIYIPLCYQGLLRITR